MRHTKKIFKRERERENRKREEDIARKSVFERWRKRLNE